MKSFEKQNLKEICVAMDAALAQVAAKFDITLKVGNISFTDTNFTAKVEASVKSENGVVLTPEFVGLQNYGKMLISEKLDINKIYFIGDRKIKFVGFKRGRMPVIYQEIDNGKCFKTTCDVAKLIVEKAA